MTDSERVLADALREADHLITTLRRHIDEDHPECAYGVLGILNDQARRDLLDLFTEERVGVLS